MSAYLIGDTNKNKQKCTGNIVNQAIGADGLLPESIYAVIKTGLPIIPSGIDQ